MGATKAVMTRWMDDILTSDLYVRASASLVRPDFRFPAELKTSLEAIPGVRSVESYRSARLEFRGDQIQIASIEFEGMMARTRHEFLDGDSEGMLQGVAHEGKCAVSDNLARKFGLKVGDPLELTTPSGNVSFPVAAAFRDFTSDRGTVFLDRQTFLKYWKDDRVDTYDVNLKPGVDSSVVRDRIRVELSGKMPALISTRKEFKAEIGQAIDAFYALIRITVFIALVVAFLGIVTALLISVAERTREIGILKALGALGPQIGRSVVLEALLLAFTGLLLALPLGDLLARFMETSVAETFAGWRMPHQYPFGLLGQLLIALPVVSAFAAWVPARQAVRTKVTEAIEYE
jgi:putative ABC transport system permease protein